MHKSQEGAVPASVVAAAAKVPGIDVHIDIGIDVGIKVDIQKLQVEGSDRGHQPVKNDGNEQERKRQHLPTDG